MVFLLRLLPLSFKHLPIIHYDIAITFQETSVTECQKEDHVEKDYMVNFGMCLLLLVTLHIRAAPGRSRAGASCRAGA